MERRLAAILAADVAGYTALMGADEAGTLQRLTDLRRDFLEPLIGRLIDRVRMFKSDRELDAQRIGGEIVSRAFSELIGALMTHKTEAETAAAAASEIIRLGGSYHYIPISHGSRIEDFTTNPLTGYSLRAPLSGDMARAYIYGPIWQGYWVDPGRTVVVGKASPEQRDLLEACAGIVETLMEMIEPGVTTSLEIARRGQALKDAAAAGRDQPAEKWPIFGHGNGLYWDLPEISTVYSDEEIPIVPGMTLGIEAVLSDPRAGSAGFEQNFIVTESGIELLTTTPMLW